MKMLSVGRIDVIFCELPKKSHLAQSSMRAVTAFHKIKPIRSGIIEYLLTEFVRTEREDSRLSPVSCTYLAARDQHAMTRLESNNFPSDPLTPSIIS